MGKVKLSMEAIENLKRDGFNSVIILGASNLAELEDIREIRFLASKELVINERIFQNSFHVSIDDPVLVEISNKMIALIEFQ